MGKESGHAINPSLHEIDTGPVKVFVLVSMDGSLTLIDTGKKGSYRRIAAYLQSINKSLKDIKYILITHSHINHIGGLKEIQSLTNAHVGIKQEGIDYLNGKAGLRMPIGHDFKSKFLAGFMRMFSGALKPLPVIPDMVLKEGAFPKEMGINARIVETPGHTSDSVSIYLEDSKTVIVGDLFIGESDGLKPPTTFEDYLALLASTKKIRELNPDLVCVSHGKDQPLGPVGEAPKTTVTEQSAQGRQN